MKIIRDGQSRWNKVFESYTHPDTKYDGKSDINIQLAVDTEYVSVPDRPNRMISTQIGFDASTGCILEHPDFGDNLEEVWEGCDIFQTLFGLKPTDLAPSIFVNVQLIMFFSPTDITRGVFRYHSEMLELQRSSTQDGRIKTNTASKAPQAKFQKQQGFPIYTRYLSPLGVIQFVVSPLDLCKVGQGSLKDILSSLSLSTSNKSSLDNYKTRMDVAYRELHEEFVCYGIGDATCLFDIMTASQIRTKTLCDVHGLPTPRKPIYTTGRLVSHLFTSWLLKQFDGVSPWNLEGWTDLKGKKHPQTFEDILSVAGVKKLATKKDTNKAINALVQGGYAKNLHPTVTLDDGVISDDDLAGAYAEAMMTKLFVVGRPTIYGQHFTSNKAKMTLGEFLKKFEFQLVDELYTITISGELNFYQDLMHSKIIESIDINEEYNEETAKINADFVLLTKQLKNAIVTCHTLELMRLVATQKELIQFMNCTVESAAYYPLLSQCDSISEYKDAATEWADVTDKKGAKVNGGVEEVVVKGKTYMEDKRFKGWHAFSMSDFVSPYLTERKVVKKAMTVEHTANGKSALWGELHAKQNGLKLVINSLYGSIASPYLPISNVVVANNITAHIRASVWVMSKSLNSRQLITDGGGCNLNKCNYWTKLPSFNTLACLHNPKLLNKDTPKVTVVPLSDTYSTDGSQWTLGVGVDDKSSVLSNGTITVVGSEGAWGELNELKKAWIQKGWLKKDGKLPLAVQTLSVDVKDCFVRAVYQSQTNNQFVKANGKTQTKGRGHKLVGLRYNDDTEAGNLLNVFEELSDSGGLLVSPQKPQTHSQILKINQANRDANSKTTNTFKENLLIAGDSISKRSWVRPFSLSILLFQSLDQWEAWNRGHDWLKEHSGHGIEQLFMNAEGSYNYREVIEACQEAINEGRNWVKPLSSRGYNTHSIISIHPHHPDPTSCPALHNQ